MRQPDAEAALQHSREVADEAEGPHNINEVVRRAPEADTVRHASHFSNKL